MNKVIIATIAAMVAFILLLIPTAEAKAMVASSTNSCSLPYVSEVVPYGKNYVATIEVAGNCKKVKVSQGNKYIRCDRVGKYTWMLRLKKCKLYTIRAFSNKSSKAIQYKIIA